MSYVVIPNKNLSVKNDFIELELDKIATIRLCERFYTSIIFLYKKSTKCGNWPINIDISII